MIKGNEKIYRQSFSDKRYTIFMGLSFAFQKIFWFFFLLHNVNSTSWFFLIIKTNSHSLKRSSYASLSISKLELSSWIHLLSLEKKKVHERALWDFQWRFRAFVRLRQAPRIGETLSKRGWGGEKVKNRELEEKPENRRDAERKRRKPNKSAYGASGSTAGEKLTRQWLGKGAWERKPRVEASLGSITPPLVPSLLPQPYPFLPFCLPERLTSVVLQILCQWLHLDSASGSKSKQEIRGWEARQARTSLLSPSGHMSTTSFIPLGSPASRSAFTCKKYFLFLPFQAKSSAQAVFQKGLSSQWKKQKKQMFVTSG